MPAAEGAKVAAKEVIMPASFFDFKKRRQLTPKAQNGILCSKRFFLWLISGFLI